MSSSNAKKLTLALALALLAAPVSAQALKRAEPAGATAGPGTATIEVDGKTLTRGWNIEVYPWLDGPDAGLLPEPGLLKLWTYQSQVLDYVQRRKAAPDGVGTVTGLRFSGHLVLPKERFKIVAKSAVFFAPCAIELMAEGDQVLRGVLRNGVDVVSDIFDGAEAPIAMTGSLVCATRDDAGDLKKIDGPMVTLEADVNGRRSPIAVYATPVERKAVSVPALPKSGTRGGWLPGPVSIVEIPLLPHDSKKAGEDPIDARSTLKLPEGKHDIVIVAEKRATGLNARCQIKASIEDTALEDLAVKYRARLLDIRDASRTNKDGIVSEVVAMFRIETPADFEGVLRIQGRDPSTSCLAYSDAKPAPVLRVMLRLEGEQGLRYPTQKEIQ